MSDFEEGYVGPQSDGTYGSPSTAVQYNKPWDIAGGTLGQYGNDVFDLLKFGIANWAGKEARQDFLDYKRWEATAGGVYMQGMPAFNRPVVAGPGFQLSGTMLLIGAGVVAFLVLKK